MNGDIVQRASRALAAEAERPAPRAPATRAQILTRVRGDRRRRGWLSAAALALSFLLVGSAALATAAPPAARRLWRVVIEALTPARETARPSRVPAPSPPARRSSAGLHTRAPALAPAAPPPPPPLAAGEIEAPPAPPPVRPLVLFRRAQHLHFDLRDFRGALAAWERFLRADPGGALAPEARYNRALCLVRLGRMEGARAALAPFADGTIPHYRSAEARALLQRIGESGTTPPASP